ncbi:uncharacterized protein LOC134260618 [Saccostrea cucullata]|uniref:uncharacterized protein LOC134260618 n=1 Tax=Saccostrea cuccullata TaxID=36930 RepID=UPI002ED4E787
MPQQPVVKRSTYCLLMLFWIALHDRSKTFGQGLDIACNDSLATVEPKQCPRNKAERDVAAAKKNCGSLKNTCRSFEYHCVINEWMNGTIDVCAPSMIIQKGKCAEFSTGFKSIRINFLTDCKKYDPPCPESYNSTEAYKYDGCYDMAILTPLPTTTFQMTTASGATVMENSSLTTVRGGNDIPKESEANVSIILIVVVIVIFVIVVIIASVIIFKMKRRRRSSYGDANESEEEREAL